MNVAIKPQDPKTPKPLQHKKRGEITVISIYKYI
jgi:hypothetical protein